LRCVACNSNDLAESVVARAPFIVERALTDRAAYSYKCAACGTTFAYPRYTESQMSLIYTGYRGIEYNHMRLKHEPDYGLRIDTFYQPRESVRAADYMLQPYLREPRILDVGGFDGANTPLKEIASAHHVLDPTLCEMKAGVKVRLPEPPYDLVVMSNVLEHVSDPYQFLIDHAQHSHKLVFVDVPLANLRRPPSHVHEHQTFFTIAGLVMLVERVKLKVLEVKVRERQILLAARR